MNFSDHPRLSNIKWKPLLPLLATAAAVTYLLLAATGSPVGLYFIGTECSAGFPCLRQGYAGHDFIERSRSILPLLTWPTIMGVTLIAGIRFRREPRVVQPLYLALPLTFLQAVLMLLASDLKLQPGVEALSLAALLGIQALLLAALVIAVRRALDPAHSGNLIYQTSFARLTLFTLVTMYAVLVSGSILKLTSVGETCAAWPWCPGGLWPVSAGGWLDILHRILVAVGMLQVAAIAWLAWQTQRFQVTILVSATAVAVLFFSQGMMGLVQATRGDVGLLTGFHSATGVAAWAVFVVLVVQVGLAGRYPVDERLAAHRPQAPSVTFRDYLALTKPIVVTLLLVTTYAGMVVGGRAWPSLSLTFWTLLGGALAAGGSSAINQFIDRNRDRLMTRTARRPMAAGRLTPAEGLAFGVALCLLAFYVLITFVNLAAAMLAVLGMVYYVVLYSLLLKHATDQNIVIGGGAGAIPPLVGWAAATGTVTLPALMLFVVIFFWTPPHFWALAIVRRKDYQRAGVPMLPVVRGERETRWQIFLYTLLLVAITLSLPLLKVGGLLYWGSALVLGVALILVAYRVWRGHGNKVAWRMYRFSSLYLAFLFAALMIDAVL